MSVSIEDVRKIAMLARLELSAEDAERMTRDLNAILEYVKKLDEVDTDGVSPHSFLEGKATPLEPDEVAGFGHIDEALANAPRGEGRFFIVPRVIE